MVGVAQRRTHECLGRELGLITRSQALAAGWGSSAVGRRVASGEWIRVHPQVYRHAAFAVTYEQRLLAAALAAGKGSAVSHRAAVGTRGVRGYTARIVEVSRPSPNDFALEGVEVHRMSDLRAEHITLHDGLPVTTPARTLIDLGAVMPSLVERCLEEWLADRVVSLDVIHQALSDHAGRGRRGVGVLRRIVTTRALGASIADSGAEALLARILKHHGLPAPIHHHLVRHADTVIAELDYAYPAQRIAIELDGYGPHLRSRQTFNHDRVRQNALELQGWHVLRYTVDRLTRQPAHVADEVRRMLAQT